MSKEAVLNAAGDIVDEVVETAETLERIPHLALNGTTRKQQVVILTAVGVASAAASSVVTALVLKKKLQAQFEEVLTEQLAAAEKHYSVLGQRPGPLEVVERMEEEEAPAANEYVNLVGQYSGQPTPDAPSVTVGPDGTLVSTHVQNVWETNGAVGTWDQAQEQSKRDANPDRPHVISLDEWNAEELDYTKDELTYFVGDDILAEPDGTVVPVHLVDTTVGEDNLLYFGHGSGDANIVYVRNPRHEMEYEIKQDPGTYADAQAEQAGMAEHEVEVSRQEELRQAALRNRRR